MGSQYTDDSEDGSDADPPGSNIWKRPTTTLSPPPSFQLQRQLIPTAYV